MHQYFDDVEEEREAYPGSADGGDKELGAVGVGSGVGHGKETRAVVGKLEVLIWGYV